MSKEDNTPLMAGGDKKSGDDGGKRTPDAGEHDHVRPSGPENMDAPPDEKWTEEDEASDESFPASDPPARY